MLSSVSPTILRFDVLRHCCLAFGGLVHEQNMLKAVDERGTEISVKLTAIANAETGFLWNDAYASQRLDRMAQVRALQALAWSDHLRARALCVLRR